MLIFIGLAIGLIFWNNFWLKSSSYYVNSLISVVVFVLIAIAVFECLQIIFVGGRR
jgi:hypothetical protein